MFGPDISVPSVLPPAPRPSQGASTPAVQGGEAARSGESDDFFSFDTLLDIVNPLQHLPVIGTLYRAITGDKINIPAKLAGDGLYGGPMGLLTSVADVLFEKITGRNVGDTVLAFFTGEDSPNAVPGNLAGNRPAERQSAELDVARFLPSSDALDEALTDRWMAADLALRAHQAYARSLTLTAPTQEIVS